MKNKIAKQENRIKIIAKPAYVVLCSSLGNPDFRQNLNLPISPPEKFVCQTLQQCSEACRNYIKEHKLGGGNWNGGQILHPDQGQIARVSYNGRIWKDNGKMHKVLQTDGTFLYMDAFDNREEITEGLNKELK